MDERTERMYELMRKESNRLKTFQMYPPWPKDYVDIKKLAKAGFFYAFNGDNVHCAFCRGQVCRWDRDDDPMTEHAKHFTTCPFIMGGEVGNVPLGEDPFPGPKRPAPYDVCGAYPNFPPSDPRYYQHHQNYETPEREQDQQHDQNLNSGRSEPTLVIQSQQSQRIITTNPQSMNISYENDQPPQSQPPQTPNNLNGICKICYTNAIELVFLPCGHSVSCLSCAQRLFNCPCCRETITTRIRTYLV